MSHGDYIQQFGNDPLFCMLLRLLIEGGLYLRCLQGHHLHYDRSSMGPYQENSLHTAMRALVLEHLILPAKESGRNAEKALPWLTEKALADAIKKCAAVFEVRSWALSHDSLRITMTLSAQCSGGVGCWLCQGGRETEARGIVAACHACPAFSRVCFQEDFSCDVKLSSSSSSLSAALSSLVVNNGFMTPRARVLLTGRAE